MLSRRRFLVGLGLLVAGCKLVPRYFGSSGTPPTPPLTAFSLMAATRGGWTWFIHPEAVQYNGNTYVGWEPGTGHPAVAMFNSSNAIVGTAFDLNTEGVDDHKNPSLLIRDSDKRLMVFFAGHGETPLYLRISTNPEDVSAFGAKVNLATQLGLVTGITYPIPHQLLSEASDPIHLFWRDPVVVGTSTWRRSVSTDGGTTWAAGTALFEDTGRSTYLQIVSNGTDRIDFAIADGHPEVDADVSIYHGYYTAGNMYKTDGTLVGAIGAGPYNASAFTLVYDGTAITSWVWDIAYDGTNPVIAYTTYPSTTNHRYNRAHWTGAAWVSHEVAGGGGKIPTSDYPPGYPQAYYSGGVVLDHADPNTVYASIGLGSNRWDIYRYVTTDSGATWSSTALTSSGKNVRPTSVRNHATNIQVLWMSGTYTNYVTYSVGTMAAGT